MVNYENGVIYINTIGDKKYVGSTANFKKRLSCYKTNFNKLKKHINAIKKNIKNTKNYDWNAEKVLKNIKKDFEINLNYKIIESFLKYETYDVKIHHHYKCESKKQLECEEERLRIKIWDFDKNLNEKSCINRNDLKEDDERIRLSKMTDEEIVTERKEKIAKEKQDEIENERIRKIYHMEGFSKNYKKEKLDTGITYDEYLKKWCKENNRYKIVIQNDVEYEVYGDLYVSMFLL